MGSGPSGGVRRWPSQRRLDYGFGAGLLGAGLLGADGPGFDTFGPVGAVGWVVWPGVFTLMSMLLRLPPRKNEPIGPLNRKKSTATTIANTISIVAKLIPAAAVRSPVSSRTGGPPGVTLT